MGEPGKTVIVGYFAVLRERRGVSQERLATSAATAGQLYEELDGRHRLGIAPRNLRAAVNDRFVAWDGPIREGDRIDFLPPSAGG